MFTTSSSEKLVSAETGYLTTIIILSSVAMKSISTITKTLKVSDDKIYERPLEVKGRYPANNFKIEKKS